MKILLSLLLLSWLALGTGHGQAISPYLAGQNAWLPTALGTTNYGGLLDRLWPVVKQSKVKMIRIGGNGANTNLVTNAQYIALIDSIRRIGAEPMVQVSEGRGRFTAAQAAQVVQHVNVTMARNVKYWIIGNEPDLNNSSQPNPVSIAGVEAYIKTFASAMKAVDPSILIVGPENASFNAYYPALLGGANDVTGTDANGRYYLDIISFHTYPFSGNQTRAQVVAAGQNVANTVTSLLAMLATANTKNNRTGANALRWALTEFNLDYANPTVNTVEGLGAHSFINGQFWAEVFGVGMKYEAVSMQPWCIHESNGSRIVSDKGYLDGGTVATIKPRSAFWHEMLISENMHGTNLNATDNQSLVKEVCSQDNGTTAVMVLNESDVTDYDFTVQLDGSAVPGAAALKINVPAGINAAYNDRITAQSTLVLLFDAQGALTRKIVYSLQHAQGALPPSYLLPGQTLTLVDFSADKTVTCLAPDAVTYTAAVVGSYTTLTWNFGAGATPATASGRGPFAVAYTTAGPKDVTLTLVNPHGTMVVNKPAYVQVNPCQRTPYNGTPALIPGVVKAIEYDFGGEGVAYHDTEAENRGATADPTVARPNEGVDTQNGDGGYGNIGYSAAGEWLKYTVNIQTSGYYSIAFRVSTPATSTGSLRLSVNDVDKTGVVAIAATGSYNTYQSVVVNNVYLDASPNATLKFDLVSSSFNISKITFTAMPPPPIVVNRVYNGSNDVDGRLDATELLVVQDHLDMRGMIVKDFDASSTTDAGGKYQFNNTPFWADMRSGTTVVLRQLAGPAGYVQDTDASDFTVDLLLGNSTYLTSASTNFNITQYEMVMIKEAGSGTAGVAGAIHTFVTRLGLAGATAGTSPLYLSVPGYKMTSPDADGGGAPASFHYPLNPTQTIADYNGAGKAAISQNQTPNWGYGFGTPNMTYIQSLRRAVTGPDLVVTYGQRMPAGGSYNSITVQNGGTLLPQLNATVATSVRVLTGGKLITNCQTLSGAGSFELQAGAELQICDPAGIAATGSTGAIQLAGSRSFSIGGIYTYNGTAAQVTGAGLPSQVRTLAVNNPAGLTLTQAVSVAQVARLQSGNLATGGQPFTLLSTADGTALVDNTGGVITGNGTMQRAVTSAVTGPAYRHMSSPVAGATVGMLATAGFAPTFNSAYNSSATPGAVAPFPTVFGYDETRLATAASNYAAFDKGWFSPADATETMQPTRGYTVNAPATAAPIAFTGAFNNATQNSGTLSRGTDADAGWHLLGNPYPAPLDWSTVTPAQRPGMDAAMYVYQSTGQYAGTYRSFVGGVGASPLIVAGSGYFARVSAPGTPGAVNLTNANRVTTFAAQPTFGRGTVDARPLLRLALNGSTLQDDAYVYFEQGATAGVDAEFDAAKLPNATGLDLATLAGTAPLAINALAPLGYADLVVPLNLRVPQTGNFVLTVADLRNFNAPVYLRDALTGTQLLLAAGSSYPFALGTLTGGAGRFSLVFRSATVTASRAELKAEAVSLYPNPARAGFTVLLPPLVGQREVRATLLNALGQAVQARTIGLNAAGATAEFRTSALAAGVYTLRLQADNQVLTKRVVIE
jgi:hypothetical protein